MGKEALKSSLRTITIDFDDATAPSMAFENGLSFEAGHLTINFRPFNNAECIDARARAIQGALEAAL